ncbi:uncharacterized protein B0I36DRAFT_245992 [Microdochium trichocladiopsis]|uniref:NmrA-like domain-containing protein n=1 Tax=Microdochium trichocladiopsis TaxID=1682393 RepID=A0A9P9BPY8_9PEZI|nr:uncharacterized protein B0I36DRAFT_245992 [Microdochium trichocladiopsis]KAH7029769.1 hypothetical protein B0I36DRAFT_245992 [Microdochium trichocladiopsis]
MAKKIITVLGVTGTQGGSVAERFLSHPDWLVRGVTRNPGSPKAKNWASRGVQLFQGDYDDVQSLKAAFLGAHAIFAVTDWASNHARVTADAALQDKARAAGRTFEEYAGDLETAQGINVATAAAEPVVLRTLERFVFSTLPAVRDISRGEIVHSWEFDSKAAAEKYMRALPPLSRVLSTVTMGIFQETWRDIPAFRPRRRPDGTFELLRLRAAAGSHVADPLVVASRDTGAFVEALVLDHPTGTDVLGASAVLSREEYAALWGRTLGVEASVRDVSEDEYRRYVPEDIQVTLLDDLKFFAEYGYTGGNAKVKLPGELGIKTTPLEEYIRAQDWSLVLSGEM